MQARPSVKIAVQPKSNSKSALKFARNTIPYHTVISRVSRNEKDRKKRNKPTRMVNRVHIPPPRRSLLALINCKQSLILAVSNLAK